MLATKSPEQLVANVFHSLKGKQTLGMSLISQLKHSIQTFEGTALFGILATFARTSKIVPSSLALDLLSKAEEETPYLPPSQLCRLPGILNSIGLPYHTLPIDKNLEIVNLTQWQVSHLAATVGPLPCLKSAAWKFPGIFSACQFGEKKWFNENEAVTAEAAAVALAAAATWKFQLSDAWIEGLKRRELDARQAQEISWGLCAMNLPFDFFWEKAESEPWVSEKKRMQCLVERGEISRPMRFAALLTSQEISRVQQEFARGYQQLKIFENGYVCDYYNGSLAIDIVPALSMETIAYLQTKRRHVRHVADLRVWNVTSGHYHDFLET